MDDTGDNFLKPESRKVSLPFLLSICCILVMVFSMSCKGAQCLVKIALEVRLHRIQLYISVIEVWNMLGSFLLVFRIGENGTFLMYSIILKLYSIFILLKLLRTRLSFLRVGQSQIRVSRQYLLMPFAILQVSTKPIKEGSEPSAFWNALGGKQTGYPAHREVKDTSKDARLFHCIKSKGQTKFTP